MSVTRVPAPMREVVRTRARNSCEYCRVHEEDTFEAHEPDHIVATQHGGLTTLENLAFACWDCNRRKGPNLSSVDPASGEVIRLFNPRHDAWDQHFRLDGVWLLGLTPTGPATIELLRLNSSERSSVRGLLINLGRYPAG